MTDYYWDYLGGNDSASGAFNAPLKHHPFMPNSTFAGSLVSGDTVQAVNTESEWFLDPGCGLYINSARANILSKTADSESNLAKLNYLLYHNSVNDWINQGNNIWRIDLVSTSWRAGRLFIAGMAQPMVYNLADLGSDRIWFPDPNDHYAYLYCTQNPYLEYGPDLAFNRVGGAVTGIQFATDAGSQDIQYENMSIVGSSHIVLIRGGQVAPEITGVRGYKWYQHGFHTFGDSNTATQNPLFRNCIDDMATQINEFPMTQERGGDSFFANGPNVNPRFIGCISKGNHHTAFSMQGFHQSGTGNKSGIVGGEITDCVGDNKHSFYGRLLSISGAREDYSCTDVVVTNLKGTNFNTTSQVSGHNITVQDSEFIGNTGSVVTGLTGPLPLPIRGEGLTLTSNPDDGFGVKEAVDCTIRRNKFMQNANPGLQLACKKADAFGNNTIEDNVFAYNNQTPDPETTDVVNAQIYLNYTEATPTMLDTYINNTVVDITNNTNDPVVLLKSTTGPNVTYTATSFNNRSEVSSTTQELVAPSLAGLPSLQSGLDLIGLLGYTAGVITYVQCMLEETVEINGANLGIDSDVGIDSDIGIG